MSTSVPCPAELAERRSQFLQHTLRREFASRSKEVTRTFDLNALKCAAGKIMAKDCREVFQVSEGGFNQIFILTFVDGTDVVARLNGSYVGNDAKTTKDAISQRLASEVSTIAYLRSETSIPVPKVYHAVTDPSNTVGTCYTLQERVIGQSLSDVWEHLTGQQREKIISHVANFEGQLLSTRFEFIGCLIGNLPNSNFQIGPIITSCVRPLPFISDFGPWKSSMDYIKAGIESEIHLLVNASDEWRQQRAFWRLHNGGQDGLSLTYATNCYQLFFNGVRQLDFSSFKDTDRFVLHHEDLCFNNIMVSYDDPSCVIAIVDWEGARVVPIWSYFMYDRFLEDNLCENDELSRLRDLRDKIRGGMDPTALSSFRPLQFLLTLSTGQFSTRTSLEVLKEKFISWFEICPQEQVPLFDELKQFLTTGPA